MSDVDGVGVMMTTKDWITHVMVEHDQVSIQLQSPPPSSPCSPCHAQLHKWLMMTNPGCFVINCIVGGGTQWLQVVCWKIVKKLCWGSLTGSSVTADNTQLHTVVTGRSVSLGRPGRRSRRYPGAGVGGGGGVGWGQLWTGRPGAEVESSTRIHLEWSDVGRVSLAAQ